MDLHQGLNGCLELGKARGPLGAFPSLELPLLHRGGPLNFGRSRQWTLRSGAQARSAVEFRRPARETDGHHYEYPPGNFTIHPEGNATETMHGLRPGPYASLDAALAEIETHTRGVCRMDEDHGQ